MHNRTIKTRKDFVPDGSLRHHRTNWNIAARKSLAQHDDVRFNSTFLIDGKERSCSTNAGLHFIHNKKRTMSMTESGSLGKETIRMHIDSLSLNWFDDESCNIATGKFSFKRNQIVEGQGAKIFWMRFKSTAETFASIHRQRTCRKSVECAFFIEHCGSSSCTARKFNCRFDAFCS